MDADDDDYGNDDHNEDYNDGKYKIYAQTNGNKFATWPKR